MDYRHPKRAVRQIDYPDRRDINDDFTPAAEKLSGLLGSHNIARDAVTAVDPDYFYIPTWAAKSVNPGWGQGVLPTFPAPAAAPDAAVPIYESTSWQAVPDMTFTINTSLGFLWINMWGQYLWPNWAATKPSALIFGWLSSRVQMAIRVDGRIIDGTIPGVAEMWGRPVIPRKVTGGTKRKTADLEGMFRHNSDIALGSGPPATPMRCSAVVPVSPGTHLVEMVVRRGPSNDPPLAAFVDVPYLYSRAACILECPQSPRDGNTSPQSVDLAPFVPGDVMSQSAMEFRRDAIAGAINAVEPGHIRRGALQREHVTQKPHLDKGAREIVDGPVTYDNNYPGYVATPFSAAPSGAGNSWVWVQDTGAGLLQTSVTHPLTWPNSDKSLFLILANVRMHEVYPTPVPAALSEDNSFNSVAAFALTKKQGGVHNVLTQSIAYVNGFGGVRNNGLGPVAIDEEWDVPLMALVEEASLPFVAHEDFGVVCSSFSPTGQAIEVVTGGAAIQVIQLRRP